jgi:hypothetical protein
VLQSLTQSCGGASFAAVVNKFDARPPCVQRRPRASDHCLGLACNVCVCLVLAGMETGTIVSLMPPVSRRLMSLPVIVSREKA